MNHSLKKFFTENLTLKNQPELRDRVENLASKKRSVHNKYKSTERLVRKHNR